MTRNLQEQRKDQEHKGRSLTLPSFASVASFAVKILSLSQNTKCLLQLPQQTPLSPQKSDSARAHHAANVVSEVGEKAKILNLPACLASLYLNKEHCHGSPRH
jgi:hypothetical protein